MDSIFYRLDTYTDFFNRMVLWVEVSGERLELSHSSDTGHVTINVLAQDMQMVTSIRARVSASTAV